MTWGIGIVFFLSQALSFYMGHRAGYGLAQWRGNKFAELIAAWAFSREPKDRQESFRKDLAQFLEDFQTD